MRIFLYIKVVFILLPSAFLQAQDKYWVYASKDELNEMRTLLPTPENCSKWLDACTYCLSADQVATLHQNNIPLEPVLALQQTGEPMEVKLGFALEQVEANTFIKKGLSGKGVKIGIIDGGFLKANKEDNLQHFFKQGLVRGYKDFVTPEMEDYGGSKMLDDDHGSDVWNLIGGIDKKKEVRFGLATGASYYLARTDHGGYERRIEEDYFIMALEWMDSLGVKLVNSSLGYNLGFTDAKENYLVNQMDGKTSAVAKAVEIAATEKGMLIVVAAGNEGTVQNWHILSTPGDAEHALTVGACKFKVWDKIDYSSIGPEYLPYVKPDVVVFSSSGTSFSAPVVTGMAACMLELNPELTNFQIIDLFKQAGNFYPYPNNYLGYGVPTCSRILSLMDGEPPTPAEKIAVYKDFIKLKDTTDQRYLVAYHKKDDRNVIGRVVYRPGDKKVKVNKMEGTKQTSLLIGKKIVEIFWD